MALKTTVVRASFSGGETATSGAITLSPSVNFDWSTQYEQGTSGANKAQHICTIDGSTDGTGVTYDLNAMTGSVVNAAAINFSTIAAIVVYNTHATQTLYVGGASTAQFDGFVANVSDIVKIPPLGKFIWEAPTPITTSSHNNLKVYGSAAATTFKLGILGV